MGLVRYVEPVVVSVINIEKIGLSTEALFEIVEGKSGKIDIWN